jgi:hypothetical protein
MVSTLQNVYAGRKLMDAAYLERYLEQQDVWGSIALDQGVNMVHSKQHALHFCQMVSASCGMNTSFL